MDEMRSLKQKTDGAVAEEFLRFMMDFYALVRRHLVEENRFRIHSHGFTVLYLLKQSRNAPLTMTGLAEEIGITKQQATKLVNDLEGDGYVRRMHGVSNRRQVFLAITEVGEAYIDGMLREILGEIVETLQNFDDGDKENVYRCVNMLSEIFRRDAEMGKSEE